MENKKINIVTLGCSKNTVDSEHLCTQLKNDGWQVVFDSNDTDAKIVIINTCGFIKDAKEESIDMILQFVEAKQAGEIEKIFVMGCLPQRYKENLQKEIPEVDAFFGVNDLNVILKELSTPYCIKCIGIRETSTPKHYAYLKIAEGCDRKCSFCAIPLIRGKHKSISIETLVNETKYLVSNGVKEIILISQDLSYYGKDLYNEFALPRLVNELTAIEGLGWIRLHYAYPANFPTEVLKIMRENDKVCNYLDIPFQHISDNMLKNMKRGHNKKSTYKLLESFRKEVPNIALRTTILTGFPNETEKDFEELKEFVKEAKFDKLGVFTYSPEEDTYACENYLDNISEDEKQARADEIMEIQQNISRWLNTNRIDDVIKVIIEREEDGFYIGRSQYDSPEVDGEVLIGKEDDMNLEIGSFYNVKVTEADDYDLYADLVD